MGLVRVRAAEKQSCSESASEREVILISGDMIFRVTVVRVNEAGLSCFLLRSLRLQRS